MRARPSSVRPSVSLVNVSRERVASVELEVVTPIFGGGATPGQVDPSLPIRGSTVRGHLRFWWRACHAPRYTTPAQLFNAESEIWGGVSDVGPSAVDVVVTVLDAGQPRRYVHLERRGSPLAYVLFPFRRGTPTPVAIEGVRFRVDVVLVSARSAEHVRQAQNALWGWTTFGGVGARTRRGCGALSLVSVLDWSGATVPELRPARPLDSWMRNAAIVHAYGSAAEVRPPLPLLDGARCLVYAGPRSMTPWAAWERAIELLRDFRKPRRGDQRTWPDADSIRHTLGHAQQRGTAIPRYPRADLGLPLVFQRMLSPDPMLIPSRGNRMASPLILKPLVLADGTAVPLILVLHAPHVWDAGGARLVWNSPTTPRDIPLPRHQLESEVRNEFVEHVVRHRDWGEVRLLGSPPDAS